MRKLSQTHKYLTGFGLYAVAGVLLLTGCESMRFGVNEGQKENAWLHNRTAAAAAQVAEVQGGSAELQDLTELSGCKAGRLRLISGCRMSIRRPGQWMTF